MIYYSGSHRIFEGRKGENSPRRSHGNGHGRQGETKIKLKKKTWQIWRKKIRKWKGKINSMYNEILNIYKFN